MKFYSLLKFIKLTRIHSKAPRFAHLIFLHFQYYKRMLGRQMAHYSLRCAVGCGDGIISQSEVESIDVLANDEQLSFR